MSIIQGNTKVSAGGYNIDQSIRFNDDDTASLYKTFASAGDRRTWTLSLWFKRGNLTRGAIFSAGTSNNNIIRLQLQSTNVLNAGDLVVPTDYLAWNSDAVYRDTSAWYHVVFRWDTTQATAADRFRVYINGTQQTPDPSIIPAQNYEGRVNQAVKHEFGRSSMGTDYIYDGYMAEINFIDGQALAPTDFGEYNDDGVWIAKAYEGTYGNNGFYITGADSADLGADYSGNGNDFTSSGLTSDDQVTDTPTDNFATLNPLNMSSSGGVTLKDGNLNADATGTATDVMATIFVNTGKYYVEYQINTADSSTSNPVIGVQGVGFPSSPKANIDRNGGYTYDGTTGTLSPSFTFTTSDVVMMAFDADAKKIWFGKNGTWYNSGDPGAGTGETLSWAADGDVAPYVRSRNASDVTVNFGQLGFDYTAPTGFSALSTANLPAPTIADGSQHFNVVEYSGTGNVTRSVTGVGFQPDLVLAKHRSNASANVIANAVSGVNTFLATEQTAAESSFTNSIYGYLSSFDSDGFTLTPGSTNNNYWNESGINIISYNWLAGNGTVSNTDGSVTSTVSVNATAGISLIGYTGTGSAATVGHGLGAEPQFIAIKGRTNVDSWGVYPGTSMGYGGQYRLKLNETSSVLASSVYWNDTDATSSVFTVNTVAQVNGSGVDYVAYCFAEVEGFSKFGKYTGNGSTDGPFIWCGFQPAWVMIKCASAAGESWHIFDTERDTYNVAEKYWYANSNAAEATFSLKRLDFLSNGVKLRGTDGGMNGSGKTYIFMAFAEHPFGGDGVAPVPAR